MVKGRQEEELRSLIDGLRRVSGVREVSSALANGWAESKPNRLLQNDRLVDAETGSRLA